MVQTISSKKVSASDGVGNVLSIALFLSGLTSLSYELVWQRLLVRTTGATLPAVSAIVCVFIGGLWLGSLVSIPLVRKSKSPLRLYAILELAIAAFGIAIPVFFSERVSEVAFSSLLHLQASIATAAALNGTETAAFVQSILCLFVLFLPALLMGITFNCVARFDSERRSARKSVEPLLSHFYAINVLGSTVGLAVSSFVLIPNVGLSITSMLMALLNLFGFFLILGCSLFVKTSDDPLLQLLTLLSPPQSGRSGTADAAAAIEEPIQAAESATATVSAADKRAGGNPLSHPQILAITVISSMVIMILEIDWIRLMMLLLGSSTYSMSSVLIMVFAAFAIAARFIAGSSLANQNSQTSFLVWSLAGAATMIVTGLYAIPFVPVFLLSFQQSLISLPVDNFLAFLIPRVIICAAVVFPPMLSLSFIFPLLLRSCTSRVPGTSTKQSEAESRQVGLMFASSAAGSIVGALFAGFILIPNSIKDVVGFGSRSGIESTLLISTILLVLMASVLAFANRKVAGFVSAPTELSALIGCGVLIVLALFLRPPWSLQIVSIGPAFFRIAPGTRLSQEKLLSAIRLSTGNRDSLFYKDGANQTVSVEENVSGNVRYLKCDGKTEAALPIDWRKAAPTSDAPTHLMLGLLPFYFCQEKKDANALVIGYGSGITSGAVTCMPQAGHITIAELEPAVYEASKKFAASNLDPLNAILGNNQKIRARVDDGRSFLRTTSEPFDVIISQPSDPWISGASDLYTREFWELTKRRLSKNGIMCQWVQLYSIDRPKLETILATFRQVYGNACLVHPAGAGEVLLIGSAGPNLFLGEQGANLSQLNQYLGHAALPIARHLGVKRTDGQIAMPLTLQCDFVLGPLALFMLTKNVSINTDDRLITEYSLPFQVISRGDNVTDNLHWLQSE